MAMASSNPFLSATGFRMNRPGYSEFIEEVQRYWTNAMSDGKLPDPHEVERWTVWLAKQEASFGHHSLILQSTSRDGFFTMELIVEVGFSSGVVKPRSRQFDPGNPPCALKTTNIGSITCTALDFFKRALRCLENFGDYNEATNNCQHYCKVIKLMMIGA